MRSEGGKRVRVGVRGGSLLADAAGGALVPFFLGPGDKSPVVALNTTPDSLC